MPEHLLNTKFLPFVLGVPESTFVPLVVAATPANYHSKLQFLLEDAPSANNKVI